MRDNRIHTPTKTMPALSTFSGNSLMSQSGGYEPQRLSNWALLVPGLENDETLLLSLKNADVPALTIQKQGIKYFNQTSHYAGSLQAMDNFTVGYHDYLDRDVLGILARWYRKVYCPITGSIGWAKDYKRQGTLYLLPPGMPAEDCPGIVSAEPFRLRGYTLRGLWPASLKYPELDHDDEGTNPVIQLELAVDMAYPISMGQ